jgi:translation initiation factor 3 subunit M
MVQDLTAAIISNTESKVVLRLKILANMYNVLSSVVSDSANPSVFVVVLLAIIKYAGVVKQMDLLHGYFDILDDLVVKWKLSSKEAFDLFLQVSLALETQGSEEKAQLFLIKALSSVDTSVPVDAEEKKLAAKCMVGAVKSPIVCFMERHDILGLRGVAALKGDSEHGKLYDLLSIFSTGKLKEYMDFYSNMNGAALLSKYEGLDHNAIIDNMRLLSMCSLATEHTEIPYESVASDLDIPLSDVETWVVRTISTKLIDAKMDQLTRRVMISRCTHRIFGPAQWKELQGKLEAWKTNLRGILETLAKTEALKTP